MNIPLFFKLTKLGWLNLFYGPALAFLSCVFLLDATRPVAFLVALICLTLFSVYLIVAKPCWKQPKARDYLTLAPAFFIFTEAVTTIIQPGTPAIIIQALLGAGFGLQFAFSTFRSYPVMKKDYLRARFLLKKRYSPGLVARFDTDAPCDQAIAKDLRRQYDKN